MRSFLTLLGLRAKLASHRNTSRVLNLRLHYVQIDTELDINFNLLGITYLED